MPIYDGDGRKKNKVIAKEKEEPSEKSKATELDEIWTKVSKVVEQAIGDTTVWSTKQAKFNRIRMRIKKPKTFPFVGSSNLRMPTAEIKIKKLKSAIVNVIFGLRPILQAIPGPSGNYDTALKIEKWMDHLIMDKMKFKEKGIMIVDQALEKGFFGSKPYWKYESNMREEEFEVEDLEIEDAMFLFDGNTTLEMVVMWLINKYEVDMSESVADENYLSLEKAAKDILSAKMRVVFTVEDVLCNYPDVSLVDPEKVYVPSTTGVSPQSAQWICHEYELSIDEVKACADRKDWDIEGVDEIKKYINVDVRTLTQFQLDQKEGIDRLNGPNNLVRIWEWYGWMDLNGDGIKEKVCITCAPDFKKILRKVGLPFDNGKWPFTKFYYELTSDRWYSHRGVVEIAEDLIKEIDTQHNMKIDYQTTNINPTKLYRAGMVNPNLLTGTPNQAIPVRGSNPLNDTLAVLNNHNPNAEYSYEKEEQILLSRYEELIGQIDYTLQSQINRRQPRTLGEVEMQQQAANTVFQLDVDQFRMQFSELFTNIWDLWCQYGNDQEEFSYFGENGWEKIRLSKEEVQGEYKFIIRGNDQNTNPNAKISKAQQIITAITNPVLLQTGVVQYPQIVAGLRRFFQTLEIDGWEQFINMQPPQPQQPPPVATLIKPKFEDLTDAEQAQVLSSVGVQVDANGRMLDKQMEMQSHAAEIMDKLNKENNAKNIRPGRS